MLKRLPGEFVLLRCVDELVADSFFDSPEYPPDMNLSIFRLFSGTG